MKRFKDLKFEQMEYPIDGLRGRIIFENGWGISVIQNPFSYGGSDGLYEIAVLDKDGEISYDSGLTEDVVGYLTEDEVSDWMEKIQKL